MNFSELLMFLVLSINLYLSTSINVIVLKLPSVIISVKVRGGGGQDSLVEGGAAAPLFHRWLRPWHMRYTAQHMISLLAQNQPLSLYYLWQKEVLVVKEWPILGQHRNICVVQCYTIELTCILYNTRVKFTVNKSQIYGKFVNSGNPKILTTPRCHIAK